MKCIRPYTIRYIATNVDNKLGCQKISRPKMIDRIAVVLLSSFIRIFVFQSLKALIIKNL